MPLYLKLSELITKVQIRISQATGTGTQTYADDRIAEMIQHKFDVLFDLTYWEQFISFEAFTLDGTNGTITTDLTEKVLRIEDFIAIFPEDSDTPIGRMPLTANPFNYSGTQPRVYTGNTSDAKVITIFPKTATGVLETIYRTHPGTFALKDTIKMDRQALILGSVYDYLEDDGTNPNATQKFQGMFDARVDQLLQNRNKAPIPLDSRNAIPTGFDFVELP